MRRIAPFVTFRERNARLCLQLGTKPPTPEKDRANMLIAFEKATSVFTGEVVSVDLLKVKFKVDKIWKGEEANEITMLTLNKLYTDGTLTVSSCNYRFDKGVKYLIYAYGNQEGAPS